MTTMNSAMSFRPMAIADLDVIVALEREIYPQPWSEGIFVDELSRDDRVYLVAERGGEVLGFAGLMLVDEDAHVTTLAVRPQERERGLGTALMLALVETGLERGSRNLTLEVRASNKGAQRLYEKFGMSVVGVRKHYYRDDDAVIMWATDIDHADYAARLIDIAADVEEAS
ncbi:MAG: ribosomal protein S18-alanine N-acetyltransferase [Acidimicrobiia bacterium]|nr:ribosomal protein S18-alanine N-acetyltransferase [Acidimicrobiia bacterium]